MTRTLSALCVLAVAGAAVQADIVSVTATGTVFFNGIGDTDLAAVGAGETVTVSFDVDSTNFVEGIPGDLRSYEIDQGSFKIAFSGGTSVGLLNPFPTTPYFTLVDGFPVSDGFFISSSIASPGGVAVSASPYQFNLDLGYVGTTLGSLDITDAYGSYAFDGLTRFSMDFWRVFPDNVVMGIDFAKLEIVPAPASAALLGLGGLVATRRRR